MKITCKTFNPIRTVLLSSTPIKLCQFYKNYGLLFKEFEILGDKHYFSINSSLCIMKRPQDPTLRHCFGGFVNCSNTNSNNSISFKYNEEKEFLSGNLNLSEQLYNQMVSSNNNYWISVLRHSSIDKLKDFYSNLGEWVKEKHNTGPLHYSVVCKGNVFEIYPTRKTKSSSMEFIVEGSKDANDHLHNAQVFDPDGRQMRFLDHTMIKKYSKPIKIILLACKKQ
ncbi:MAG: hypothetical protein EOP33_00985 [Rickettsiaceae bacterium]|nr:MAG: hypothetical protein EOP33_00985 [Rickettsiaceae bacterium]